MSLYRIYRKIDGKYQLIAVEGTYIEARFKATKTGDFVIGISQSENLERKVKYYRMTRTGYKKTTDLTEEEVEISKRGTNGILRGILI